PAIEESFLLFALWWDPRQESWATACNHVEAIVTLTRFSVFFFKPIFVLLVGATVVRCKICLKSGFFITTITMGGTLTHGDNAQLITIVLDGFKYLRWSTVMKCFLRKIKVVSHNYWKTYTYTFVDLSHQYRIMSQLSCLRQESCQSNDKMHLVQFLMTLQDEFEPTKVSLLNQQPLSSLSVAVS
ncbi:hypothetical protein CFOL_v3_10981, partial [Cephalotus follicularis]